MGLVRRAQGKEIRCPHDWWREREGKEVSLP